VEKGCGGSRGFIRISTEGRGFSAYKFRKGKHWEGMNWVIFVQYIKLVDCFRRIFFADNKKGINAGKILGKKTLRKLKPQSLQNWGKLVDYLLFLFNNNFCTHPLSSPLHLGKKCGVEMNEDFP